MTYTTPLTAGELSPEPPPTPTRFRSTDFGARIPWEDVSDPAKVMAALDRARLDQARLDRLCASPAWRAGVVDTIEGLEGLEASRRAIPWWQRPSMGEIANELTRHQRELVAKLGGSQ